MRQLRFLFAAGVIIFGLVPTTEAQQPALPNSPSNQLSPLIPVPDDADGLVNGTLQTTTVQSQRPPYDPNQKVTGDEYYSLIGTTGSYRVNTDRAKEYQDAALQRARRQKALKDDLAATRHYRMTYDSSSAAEYLKSNPPHPNPAPLTEPAETSSNPPSAPTGGSMPPEESIEYIKMRGSGGSLAGLIRTSKSRNPPEVTTPLFSETETPQIPGSRPSGPPPGSNVPLPPTTLFRPGAMNQDSADEINAQPKTGLFARFLKPSQPEPVEAPAAPFVAANQITDTPPEPAYPSGAAASFSTVDEFPELVDSPASAALVSPPERKSLFSSMFSKKQNSSLPEVAAVPEPVRSPDSMAVPPPTFKPFTQTEAKPAIKSIFRPNASARRTDAFSVVKGDEVFAIVDGEELKLSAGTRVRVLREGTDRSLVRLYDNRQATIANSALTPEAE